MKVLVVGGGLGGLALGAGLRRAGIEVKVLEKDVDLAATGGYHITLHSEVQAALARLLPASTFEKILASAADGRLRDPDVLWDPKGRQIGKVRLKGSDRGIDVDRITLRLLLAEAVGDDLLIGRVYSHFERSEDGPVVHLEDSEQLAADVVVGADGVHSKVAQQLAGGPTNAATGIVGISGRTPISELEPRIQQRLGTRSSLGIGPNATALYLGYIDPIGHAVLEAPELRRSVTAEPTFIWGAMFAESEQTKSWAQHKSSELLDSVLETLKDRHWGSSLTNVLSHSLPNSVGLFRFYAAPREAHLQAPWPAGAITALGDAVHATPPTAGMGAGAAIRDAAELTEHLAVVERDEELLLVAIRDFQASMRQRGAEVIAASVPTIRQILMTGTPFGSAVTKAVLPIMAIVNRLRH